jgi:hypothetical protein
MKKLILIFTLALTIANFAFAIGPAYSGSWYNPEQSGHGFSLEYSVLNDGTPLVVAYWYVYDSEGNPVFLIGMGEPEADNTATLEFEAPYGMKFGEFDPEQTVRGNGGTGVFTFEDSESGQFSYQPSQWMKDTYDVSAVSLPVIKLLGVEHPNPEIVELHIGAKLLTTTERTGAFPVCFNGVGELLPCESNDPPPTGDSFTGSWTGRMVYDRNSAAGGACWDADVQVVVILSNNGAHYMERITVSPDTGGLYISSLAAYVSDEGHTNGIFAINDQRIDYTISFNTQGHAQGVWTYQNSDCYGDWTFTKD